jgi:hypothetical protein
VSTAVVVRELQPFSEMPVWGLMAFEKAIPERYVWGSDTGNPRKMSEVTVIGFQRLRDSLIDIDFYLEWIIDGEFVKIRHCTPLVKDGFRFLK